MLKRMSAEDKASNTGRIKKQIASLREENAAKRAELQEQLKGKSTSLREKTNEVNTKLREDNKGSNTKLREVHKSYVKDLTSKYDNMYISELDKIRNTAAFQRPTRSRKR